MQLLCPLALVRSTNRRLWRLDPRTLGAGALGAFGASILAPSALLQHLQIADPPLLECTYNYINNENNRDVSRRNKTINSPPTVKQLNYHQRYSKYVKTNPNQQGTTNANNLK